MKLKQFIKNIEKNQNLSVIRKRNELENESSKRNKSANSSLKIIGITGSKGKSTTAFIVHQYLKKAGYRSVLYSSIAIDSPLSFNNKNEAVENPIRDRKMVYDAIYQANEYGADFLVLEVNERAIAQDFITDVPFSIRALTNLIPAHNKYFYKSEDYVKIKKSFFENIPEDEECMCIYGLSDGIRKSFFEELLSTNNKPYKTFSSKYIATIRGVELNKIDYLMHSKYILDSLSGLDLDLDINGKEYNFTTNMIMPYNALNISCAIAILDALNVFDYVDFQNTIQNITVPGRDETITINGRTIIISISLVPQLEALYKYKINREACLLWEGINDIKVVVGSPGLGYHTWIKEFSEDILKLERSKSQEFAFNYLKQYADYIYVTTNDNGAISPQKIVNDQVSYLDSNTKYEIELDRELAIKKAIQNSKEGDIIYISGRGNRRLFCNSALTTTFIMDREVVDKVLEELNWR